jgi:Rrf2 family protein
MTGQKSLKVSAKARYALRILLDVAANASSGAPRTGAAIAKAQQISEKFLSRIVVTLRRKGMLRSVRGNVGGFQLAMSPDDIRLLDVVEAMQGPLAVLDCLAPGAAACPRAKTCLARRVWADVNAAFASALAKVTLASILRRDPKAVRALDYCI